MASSSSKQTEMSSSSKQIEKPLSNDAKRARLNRIGRGTSYVSDRGKVAVIKDIKELGIPEHSSRGAFARARLDVAISNQLQ